MAEGHASLRSVSCVVMWCVVALLGSVVLQYLLVRHLGPWRSPAADTRHPAAVGFVAGFMQHQHALMQLPKARRQYLVYDHPGVGLGNVLRGLLGILQIALLNDRILCAQLPDFLLFFRPLFPCRCHTLPKRGHVQAPQWFTHPNGTVYEEFLNATILHATASGSRTWWADSSAVYRLTNILRSVPTKYDHLRGLLALLFSRPKQGFASTVAHAMAKCRWSEYRRVVSVHYRQCVDCGDENISPPEFVMHAVNCIWSTLPLAKDGDTLFFIASDSAAAVRQLQTELGRRGQTCSYPSVNFTNSESQNLHPSKLLPSYLDWWLLGEADLHYGSGTTYGTTAALRRGIPITSFGDKSGPQCGHLLERSKETVVDLKI